jgi:uroporphyrin-III C-methyltransferase
VSVYLVGAGPGDPELITVRGLELLRRCDVLVYDRLVAPDLVAEAPDEALRISREPLRQAAINDLLVAYGRRGLDVVRLKGGDPFVFGRGGEEALALAEAGVPFEIVPGVSSLQAVPAAAGIPITHRGVASQVTVLSGHDGALDYGALARAPGTLVMFMALSNLEAITSGLVANGKDALTPSAVVSCGTLPEQRTVTAPLAEIAQAAGDVESPALLIVGDTVALAERLAPMADAHGRAKLGGSEVRDGRAVDGLALVPLDERVPVELVAYRRADGSRPPAVDHAHLRETGECGVVDE